MVKHGRASQLFICFLVAIFMLAVVIPGQAEASTEEEKLEELRELIRDLPDRDNVTEEDKPAIKEALAMRDRLMDEYGITEYDICVLGAKLAKLEGKVDNEDEALPPTGGATTPLMMGLLSFFAGVAILIPRKRQ
ncbi:MAG: hypothetical protein R6U91_09935 [Bacillota bacterium]